MGIEQEWNRYVLSWEIHEDLKIAHETMLSNDLSGALIIYDNVSDIKNTLYGSSSLGIAIKEIDYLKTLSNKSVCIFIPHIKISVLPSEFPCNYLTKNAEKIISIDTEIKLIKSTLELQNKSILQSFKLSASNANIMVVHDDTLNEFSTKTNHTLDEINKIKVSNQELRRIIQSQLSTIESQLALINSTLRSL